MRIKSQTGTKVLCDHLDSLSINQYGIEELRKRIRLAITRDTFPYGEESVIVETLSEHKCCMWCAHKPQNHYPPQRRRAVLMAADDPDEMRCKVCGQIGLTKLGY
jgi:hypothetical protein